MNARHMKEECTRTAPTGTSANDYRSCTRWGLLRAAFRPGQDICAVRTLQRHRSELLAAASQHVQHMHKAFTQMNLQIHHVIHHITGLIGLAIVDAILAGQREGAELAKLRDPHIKANTDTIRKSLEGNWRPEHLFTLAQSRDLYRTDQQIANCDLEIEKMLPEFEPRVDPAERPLLPDRKRKRSGRKKNGFSHPEFDLRTETYKLFRLDVTQIPGLQENALPLFSELGRDMSP
jgi:transposase